MYELKTNGRRVMGRPRKRKRGGAGSVQTQTTVEEARTGRDTPPVLPHEASANPSTADAATKPRRNRSSASALLDLWRPQYKRGKIAVVRHAKTICVSVLPRWHEQLGPEWHGKVNGVVEDLSYVLQWAAILSNWWAMKRLGTDGEEVPAIFDDCETFFYHCIKIVLNGPKDPHGKEAKGRGRPMKASVITEDEAKKFFEDKPEQIGARLMFVNLLLG